MKWISVKSYLPKDEGRYLTWNSYFMEKQINICTFENGVWLEEIPRIDVTEYVTHWTGLPPPPKDAEFQEEIISRCCF